MACRNLLSLAKAVHECIRPGEKIPVDGEVISGRATLDQSAITGESMPIEVSPGSHVFAAALAASGLLPPILAAAAQSLPDLGYSPTQHGCYGKANIGG
jgi:high-affinity K+ transport system ATPase subunit B